MAYYQVVCVRHVASPDRTHQHISHLGVGTPTGYQALIAVEVVIAQLRSLWGDRYFTVSPSTGVRAEVIEGGCETCGQRPYVRTTADRLLDNNLSGLPFCAYP